MEKRERAKPFDFRRYFHGRGPGQARLQFAPDDVICAQDDPADALFYIEGGWIKIALVSPKGKEAVIALCGAGEMFGTRCLVAGHRRLGSVTALTDCSVVRVGRMTVLRLIRHEAGFAEMFTIFLMQLGIRREQTIIDHLTHSAEKRLARALLQLADYGGGRSPQLIPPPINQAVLASLIGTTRGRVSFFMNKFRKQGLIEYDRQGHVRVRNGLLRFLLERSDYPEHVIRRLIHLPPLSNFDQGNA